MGEIENHIQRADVNAKHSEEKILNTPRSEVRKVFHGTNKLDWDANREDARGSALPMPGRCGAKLSAFDPPRYCKQKPDKQGINGRCRFHGSRVLTGAAHPHFKTGRWSKHMPKPLIDAYHDAIEDGQLLSLKEELATLEALICERLERYGESVSNDYWRQLGKAAADLNAARRSGDEVALAKNLDTILQMARAGSDLSKLTDELKGLMEARSHIASRQAKIAVDLQYILTNDNARAFVQSMAAAVKEQVSDPDVLERIAKRFRALIGERETLDSLSRKAYAQIDADATEVPSISEAENDHTLDSTDHGVYPESG